MDIIDIKEWSKGGKYANNSEELYHAEWFNLSPGKIDNLQGYIELKLGRVCICGCSANISDSKYKGALGTIGYNPWGNHLYPGNYPYIRVDFLPVNSSTTIVHKSCKLVAGEIKAEGNRLLLLMNIKLDYNRYLDINQFKNWIGKLEVNGGIRPMIVVPEWRSGYYGTT